MDARSLLAGLAATRLSRFVAMAAFVLLLLLASRIAEHLLLSHAEGNWESVSDERCTSALAAASARFADLQRALRRTATDLATHPDVLGYLDRASQERERVFRRVSDVSTAEVVGIEIYDRDRALIAWEGPGGRTQEDDIRGALQGRMSSYAVRAGAASHLVVVIPVRARNSVVGAAVVQRMLESNAPLNNPLLRVKGLSEALSAELGLPVDFTFPGEGESARDGRYRSTPLFGIDSAMVGSVSVLRPVRSAHLDMMDARFRLIDATLWTLLLGLCAMAAATGIRGLKTTGARCIALTLLIWGARYALVVLEVPTLFFSTGIFDPALFASPFGGGLAKSVGELFVTLVALTVNVVVVARELTRSPDGNRRKPLPAFVSIPLAAVGTFFLFWVLRGYGAAVRAAAVDSSLLYFDARVILPTAEIAFMVLNLFLLGGCVIVASIGLTCLIVRLLGTRLLQGPLLTPWRAAAILYVLAAVLFGVSQENPLMSTAYRAGFGLAVIYASYRWMVSDRGARARMRRRHVLIVIAGAGILLYPLLDKFSHEKDRSRIEIFAADELKPVDGWLKYIVEEALQGFNIDEYRERLSEGTAGDVAGIAFERWAASLACSQGYDAIFTVTDPDGREAGRFVIGGSVAAMNEADIMLPLGVEKTILVRNIGTGINALKVYAGSMPLLGTDSVLLGYARVVVAAGQQSLFRGETPVILRGTAQSALEAFYRRVTLSEYRDGILLTSNDPAVPLAHPLPETVAEALGDSGLVSIWADDRVGGDDFETFYVRRSTGSSDVVSLGMRELGFAWHLVSIVKLFAAYLVCALLVLLVARIAAMRRGGAYRLTYRDRLLLALLATAILPLTLIALYIGIEDRERAAESIERRLDEETQNVIYNITDHPEPGVTILNLPADRYAVEALAADIETDFNVYTDRQLRASSKQVLYDVGIFESRLSGNAYARIILGGERFVTQTERVGSVAYTAGYRPVLDARGDIIGVVSVPTLYRAEESEEQVARRNAFLLGAYAIALVAIILIAAFLANRIASPIQQLTEATRRVARGELDVHIPIPEEGGEIGNLIRAFDQMTRDLRRTRDELVRYERELAWKEMAKQVAHEIKNPLTPMRLSIQHLRKTYLDRAPDFAAILETVTKTIVEQIDTLSKIATEFSHFARMPRRSLARLRVEEVVEEAAGLFSQEARLRFNLEGGAGIPDVIADREELRRALINVIRNGIQAMDGKGRIVIRTFARDGGVAVTVTDFGKGIPEEIRPKLFEPNFSTKTDGMGLGLAIVKKTVDDLGGTVDLTSSPASGTTVTIWLPGAQEQGRGLE